MKFRLAERVDRFGTNIIRDIFKHALDPEITFFGGGAPAPELYPYAALRAATVAAYDEYGPNILGYDVTPGFLPLRETIAAERMKATGVVATATNVIVTSGSQQGIDLAARVFLEKGDTVICEAPSYLGAINCFDSYGVRYAQVSMDDDGMIMGALEATLASNPTAKFIYTVPDFQNPTGVTLSLERRRQMVDLARQFDVPILEDSAYIELRYEGERLPAIKSFDADGHVIYLGSFSKIVSPGLRLGWVCADENILEKMVRFKEATDLHTSTFAQRLLTSFMKTNSLSDHIATMLPVYRARRDAMLEAMDKDFSDDVSFTRPDGGFFCWVTLPESVDAGGLFQRAIRESKVAIVPGRSFFAGDGPANHFRLSFSQVDEARIAAGIGRLSKLI